MHFPWFCYLCIYIYIYICVCVCIYIYIYIYIKAKGGKIKKKKSTRGEDKSIIYNKVLISALHCSEILIYNMLHSLYNEKLLG